MSEILELKEKPVAQEIYMIAGWRQWADAGSISSALPQYIIDRVNARKIGSIKTEGFYIFQVPGAHHFLRPEIKLEDGHRQSLEVRKNDIYYAGDDNKGLVIFLGDEPHINVELYTETFMRIIKELNVKRVVVLGGVYGSMPYDKSRDVSSVYSLKHMKNELEKYSVRFSNYEGGATIGSYMLDQAEKENIEYLALYAFVPAYDFSQSNSDLPQGIRIDNDFQAWLDIMSRIKHMFDLGIDLSDLERRSQELRDSIDDKMDELDEKLPHVDIRTYMAQLADEFEERPFVPLDDIWEREFGDLFKDDD